MHYQRRDPGIPTIGLSSVSLWGSPLPLADRVRVLAEGGVRLLELDLAEWYSSPDFGSILERAMRAAEEAGVRVSSFHLPSSLDVSAPTQADRRTAVEVISSVLDAVQSCVEAHGVSYLVLHPGGPLKAYTEDEYNERTAYCLESVSQLLRHATLAATKLALENTLSAHYGGRPTDLSRCLEALPSERVGVCVDCSHALFDYSVPAFLQAFPTRVLGYHLSENERPAKWDLHAMPYSLPESGVDWEAFWREVVQLRLPRLAVCEVFASDKSDVESFLVQFREARVRLLKAYKAARRTIAAQEAPLAESSRLF